MSIRTHKDLDVWNKSMELAEEIYQLTKGFPREERFGLTSQIRRSAISIPSNIAEGAARSSKREFIQFLYVAMGSLSEVETQLLLAKRLTFLSGADIFIKIESIRRMLLGLIRHLKGRER